MLESFEKTMRKNEEADRYDAEQKKHILASGFLDPVLAIFMDYATPSSLKEKIEALFDFLDTNNSNSLSFEEMQAGLLNLRDAGIGGRKIQMSKSDWESFTANCQLDEDGGLSPAAFDSAINFQLILYSHRLVAEKMAQAEAEENTDSTVMFLAFKVAMLGIFRTVRSRCVSLCGCVLCERVCLSVCLCVMCLCDLCYIFVCVFGGVCLCQCLCDGVNVIV